MKHLKWLVLVLALMPLTVNALNKNDYKSLNLKEVLTQEEIEPNLSNYKESNDQITIYLFRGDGCGYCKAFLTFLNSIVPEYGKYFKLESYEVWHNAHNAELLEKVSAFNGEVAGGVPYIVIGDKVFPGYAEKYNDSIKAAIMDLYNSKNRYDVFEAMAKAEWNSKVKGILTYAIDGVALVVACGSIYLNNRENKKLKLQIAKLEDKVKKMNTENKAKAKKETVKKTTKKTTKKAKKSGE